MKTLRLLLAAALLAVNSAAWADLSGPVSGFNPSRCAVPALSPDHIPTAATV